MGQGLHKPFPQNSLQMMVLSGAKGSSVSWDLFPLPLFYFPSALLSSLLTPDYVPYVTKFSRPKHFANR